MDKRNKRIPNPAITTAKILSPSHFVFFHIQGRQINCPSKNMTREKVIYLWRNQSTSRYGFFIPPYKLSYHSNRYLQVRRCYWSSFWSPNRPGWFSWLLIFSTKFIHLYTGKRLLSSIKENERLKKRAIVQTFDLYNCLREACSYSM